MRHVFILNPAAGKKKAALTLIPAMEAACRTAGLSYALRVTTAPGAATEMAREEAAAGEPVRLYACGGDGTLLEVLTGVGMNSAAEVAHIPCGSGNDFVKTFGGAAPFLSVGEMIHAPARAMDGICFERAGEPSRPALNVAATGMDATVAYDMERFKHWPLVSGSMAYDLALAKVFFGRLGCRLTAEMDTPDGTVRVSGSYLFALCANGQYYGGGYRGAPFAVPDDGLLDFVLVDTMPRRKMLGLIPKYKAGTHPGQPGIHMWRGTSMTVRLDHPQPATLDGECFVTDRFCVRVVPGAWRMVIPQDAVCPQNLHGGTATCPN